MRIATFSFEDSTADGFAVAPVNSAIENGDVLGTGSPQIITGAFSLILKDKISTAQITATQTSELFFGGRIKSWHPDTNFAVSGLLANHKFFEWTNNLGDIFAIRNNPTSLKFELQKNNATLATGTKTIASLTNMHMEIHVAPASNLIGVKVNGDDDIVFVGAIGTTCGNVTLMGPGNNAGDVSATSAHWFDDCYVNDTSNADGNNDTSWAGQIKIKAQPISGNGFFETFGSNPPQATGSSWLNVSDFAPNDAGTTYVFSGNPGNVDDFIPANLAVTGPIKAITPIAVARTKGPAASIKVGLAPNNNIHGQFYRAAQPLTTSFANYKARFTKDPFTLLPWLSGDNSLNFIDVKHDS